MRRINWVPLLAVFSVIAALLAITASSGLARTAGDSLPQFKNIIAHPGYYEKLQRGGSYEYSFGVANLRHNKLGTMQLDIYIPKQSVRMSSLRWEPAPGVTTVSKLVVGHHLRWVLRGLSPGDGSAVTFLAHVARTAKGLACNKMVLTYAGKTGDYSPPCSRVG